MEQPSEPVLLEPRALALGQHARDHRALGDRRSRPPPPPRCRPRRSARRADSRAAPGRSGRRRSSCRARAPRRGAASSLTAGGLPVVGRRSAARRAPSSRAVRVSRFGDQHLAARVGRHLHRPAAARPAHVERLLAVLLAGRARALASGQRATSSPSSAPSSASGTARAFVRDDLLRALRGRGRLALAERLLEPLERRAQLELAERLAQPRAVGLARGDVVEVDLAELDVADGRWRASSRCARPRRGWSGSPCAWRRRSCRCSPSTPSRSPCSWSSCEAVFSPMPGTPGMLSEVSPFSPTKSGISSGAMP